MKITIEEISDECAEEIVIRCYEMNENILELINKIKNHTIMLTGYSDDRISKIKTQDVYYIESVDNKVFIYCKKNIWESKKKLYELEEICDSKYFFRAAKSVILNVAKISSVRPILGGRFEALMENGEKVIVSRQYVPILKKMLGL